jgi:hypothetical protein
MNVKAWYLHKYPNDELGKEINEDITFEDVFRCLDNYGDFYNLINVGDSLMRERIFEKFADISGHTYAEIYDKWMMSEY